MGIILELKMIQISTIYYFVPVFNNHAKLTIITYSTTTDKEFLSVLSDKTRGVRGNRIGVKLSAAVIFSSKN